MEIKMGFYTLKWVIGFIWFVILSLDPRWAVPRSTCRWGRSHLKPQCFLQSQNLGNKCIKLKISESKLRIQGSCLTNRCLLAYIYDQSHGLQGRRSQKKLRFNQRDWHSPEKELEPSWLVLKITTIKWRHRRQQRFGPQDFDVWWSRTHQWCHRRKLRDIVTGKGWERDAIGRKKENSGEGDEAPRGINWYGEKERIGRKYWWGKKVCFLPKVFQNSIPTLKFKFQNF